MRTKMNENREQKNASVRRVGKENSNGGTATIADRRHSTRKRRKLIEAMNTNEVGITPKRKGKGQNRNFRFKEGREVKPYKTVAALNTYVTPASGVRWDDMGNGVWGSYAPINANDVTQLINHIRANIAAGDNVNRITILTGTHGAANGDLTGDTQFYTEDMAHAQWGVGAGRTFQVSVQNINGWSQGRLKSNLTGLSSVVIMAWCNSRDSYNAINAVPSTIVASWPTF